jgi:hypothetical protein
VAGSISTLVSGSTGGASNSAQRLHASGLDAMKL